VGVSWGGGGVMFLKEEERALQRVSGKTNQVIIVAWIASKIGHCAVSCGMK
jgi:hypothetical protein